LKIGNQGTFTAPKGEGLAGVYILGNVFLFLSDIQTPNIMASSR